MFMPAMIFTRLVIAGCRFLGGGGCSTSTPSIRYFTVSFFSKGSTWMSDARARIPSSTIRLTRLMSEGCSAMRCRSAASTASRLFTSSSASACPPSLAAICAAVMEYAVRIISSKTSRRAPIGVTGLRAWAATSSAASKSAGSIIATSTRPCSTV